jgi:8-amino-7-oxononanoate synthase
MPLILDSASKKLRDLEENHRLRELHETRSFGGMSIKRDEKSLLSFSSNDYLGLSQHPALIKASVDATQAYGTGAGASRLVSGNYPLYAELESELAAWKGCGGALVFGSGYLANMGTIPALAGTGDLIIADKLIHACMIDGALLSGATLHRFAHNDIDACKRLLENHRGKHGKCLILTEGIFSMDGDAGNIEALYELAVQHDALLMADDAHGLGVTHGGKGLPYLGENMLLMGTFSKSAGSYGGYVCASKILIHYIINTARSFIFSTGLPPATVAASLAAIRIIREDASLNTTLWQNIRLFEHELGLKPSDSAIIPIILRDDEKALIVASNLADSGFYVSAVRPPTVPPGTSRLRITLSARHEQGQILALTKTLKKMEVV